MPAFILMDDSGENPILSAISSAVLKPTPAMSSASLYGFSRTIFITFMPYSLYIFIASALETPYWLRKIIALRNSFFSSNCVPISMAFFSVIPFISASLSGSLSMILKVSSPNFLTIFAERAGPTPLIMPEPRYFSMATEVSGSFIS